MVSEMPLPKGRVTIVFTDIENSSLMTSDLGNAAYLEQLRNPHQKVLLEAFGLHHGVAIQTQGDSFMAVFQYAKDALACVTAIQNRLETEPLTAPRKAQPEKGVWTLRVRMGVHTTEQEVVPERLAWIPNAGLVAGDVEYSGTDTNFAARIGGLGIGGQVIVSHSTYTAADTRPQYRWQGWPNRRLKSFEAAPETVWELLYDGRSRGEPGLRWVPDWYRGELNRYIARPELQEPVINYFKTGRDNVRKRLVTLHAEGGMGKSRLAVACALEMVGLFQNGVYFVNLARDEADASFRTREAVAQTIGLALGLSGQDLQPENLLAFLPTKEMLLVLDNYESVDGPEVRRFLRDLLNRTTSLCLLVTGRTPVGLTDVEQIVPMDEGMTPEQARSLFLAYASLQKPQWTPDENDEWDLTRILVLTENIPLAVELAAAWVGAKSLKEIADGLEATPLGKYSGTEKRIDRADPSPHHYSLTRSLDWSYNLLETEARDVFSAVSLFADSFDVEAVAAVVAEEVEQIAEVLDYLHRVSLVRRTEVNKTSRYSLHRFTRSYAAEKLDALPLSDDLRREFVFHYAQLVAHNCNLNDAKCRAVMELELNNTLAAVQIADFQEWWLSLLPLGHLGNFLGLRGRWLEQERLYLPWLAAAKTFGNHKVEGQADVNLGNVYWSRGEWDKAERSFGEGLGILSRLGDRQGEGIALMGLGNVYWRRGEWDKAEQAFKESLVIRRELGDRQGEAGVGVSLGSVNQGRGEWDKAEQAFKESLLILRELGERQGQGISLHNLGGVYGSRGEWDKAEQAFKESLDICCEIGDRQGEGIALGGLGNVYWSRGEWDKAEQAFKESLVILRELGDRQGEGIALGGLGNVYDSRGEWDRAEQAFKESLVIRHELGDRQGEGVTLVNLSDMYDSRGDWGRAEQVCRESLVLFRELSDRWHEGFTLGNMAELMQKQKKQREAIAYAREAVAAFEQTEDAARLANVRKLLEELGG